MSRVALGAMSALALLVSTVWWLATGLLAGDDHSACSGDFEARAAFWSSFAGALLALAGLGLALADRRLRLGWMALALYAMLLAASVVVFLTCEDDLTKETGGELGEARVSDVASLRKCLKGAGVRIADSSRDLRFPTGVQEFYVGKLPNGSRVVSVRGQNPPFRLYVAGEPDGSHPGINRAFETPERLPLVGYVYPVKDEVAADADRCLPRMEASG